MIGPVSFGLEEEDALEIIAPVSLGLEEEDTLEIIAPVSFELEASIMGMLSSNLRASETVALEPFCDFIKRRGTLEEISFFFLSFSFGFL